MSAATEAGSPIQAVLAQLETRGARMRPVLAAAMLIAVLSLAAATVLMLRSFQQARQLEEQARQLKDARQHLIQAVAERDRVAADLARLNRVLSSRTASPAELQTARETSQGLAETVPGASREGFAMPAAVPTPGVQLLTLGAATGWDIDFFWCAGPGSAANYSAARGAAVALAGAAAGSEAIAPGVRVGRIRLRPIQPADTPIWRRAADGRSLFMVTDSGRGEAEAAKAVLGRIGGDAAAVVDQGSLGGAQAASRWYLSAIACTGG